MTNDASKGDDQIEHAVLLIHGIRDWGEWHQKVQRVLESNTVRVSGPKYGYISPLPFVLGCRRRPSDAVYQEYQNARRMFPKAEMSVIAHSYGSHILTELLRHYPDMRFSRIVLCGSVVKQGFRWDTVSEQIGPREDATKENKYVVNDCGNRDIWPVIGAFAAGRHYGNAGTHGFGSFYVSDRYHDGKHSLFFDEDFIERYWKPFIERGTIVPGSAKQGEKLPLLVTLLGRLTAWGLNLWFTLLSIAVLVLVTWCAVAWWFGRPEFNQVTFPEFVNRLNDARSKGSVAEDQLLDEYRGDIVEWQAVVIKGIPDTSTYRIGVAQEGRREDQALAELDNPDDFKSFVEGETITLRCILYNANDLGILLKDCVFAD